jgi:hypothetical protein
MTSLVWFLWARNAYTACVVWHCVSDSTRPGLRIGAVFPQTELGHDTGAVRAWGQEVERAGYRHVLIYDHVLGADPAVHTPWDRPYDVRTTFREPFVLFG